MDVCKSIIETLTQLTIELGVKSVDDKQAFLEVVSHLTGVLNSALDDDTERLNEHTKEFVNAS